LKELFWVGVVLTIVAPLIIGIHYEDPSTSWVAALCGAFITFISKLDQISELSLGPVKAKMKEKIDEVDKVLKQLREAVTVTSHATLTDLMAGGMMGSMTLGKRLEIHENIILNLRAIGASEEQVAMAEKDWIKAISIIYVQIIRNTIEERESPNTVNFKTPDNKKQASLEIDKLEDFSNWQMPTPYQIRAILESHTIKEPPVDLWVNDYEHFLNNNEICRPEELIAKREKK
jgi:hypothetical protein